MRTTPPASRTATTSLLSRPSSSVDVVYQYAIANNGLAVWLSADEAATVARMPGVVFMQRDFQRELQTDASVPYLGAPGIWDGSEVPGGVGTMGEGMIIGVIDTGVSWQNPSFAAVGPVDGYVHTNPYPDYRGNCETGSPNYQDICNDKLVGAYGYAGNGYDARDYDGHGSHTSSIAGGNIVDITDPVTVTIQGVAPHANIIAYASCCSGSDLSASIDDAILDGVDAINYSIGSASPSDVWNDFDTVGYLNAREAGVFVATSAGNNGPDPETVGSPADAPWLTAVGNHNHTRVYANLGDVTGPTPVPPELQNIPIVNGADSAEIVVPIENDIVWAGDVDPGNELGCNAFPAGVFADAIALIQRGDCTFATKEQNASDAGAIAMIVFNHSAGPPIVMGGAGSIIPSLFMAQSNGLAVVDWIQTQTGPTFRINPGIQMGENPLWPNIIAAGSSRGANRALPDIVKPDVASFGTSVLAAYATYDDIAWNFLSGTSMASPHAAGAATLLMALYPSWTPAEVQSALMTTAWDDMIKEDGLTPSDAFDVGSGRIQLAPAAQAGLVLDESIANYWAADPALGGDPKTLNLASMGNGACVGTCTWERTVRSTLPAAQTWEVSATSAPTITLDVSPAVFTLDPGMTQTLVISADVTSAPQGEWFFGKVTLVPTTTAPAVPQGSTSLEEKLAADANADPAALGQGIAAPDATFPLDLPDDAYIGVLDGNDGFGADAGMACDDVDTSAVIPGGTPVSSVEVQLAANHTWIGDMTVKLMSPDGTIVAMMERVQGNGSDVNDGDTGTGCCGDSDNMVSSSPVNFADAFPTDSEAMGLPGGVVCQDDGICEYWPNPDQAFLVGSSAEDFEEYNGEEASGTWQLCAADSAAGDLGSVDGWTLCVNGECFENPEPQTTVSPAHLPVAVRLGASSLPDLVEIVTDQLAGTQTLADLQVLDDITDLTVENFGLTLADRTEAYLYEDPTNGDPYDNLDDVLWFTTDVPAGALRFVAEVIISESPDLDLFVGTGDTPSAATQVCVSAGGSWNEYCNINDPAEGGWWVLVQNWSGSGDQPDRVVVTSAAVDDADNGNMTVTGPAAVPAGMPFDLDVNWNEPSMVGQDRWYGTFTIGTDPGNPGNVGTVNVNLEFLGAFMTKAGPDAASMGDVISYTITIEGPGPISNMAVMTDVLPAGVDYADNLTYTYGIAWYDAGDNAVYWTSAMPGAATAERAAARQTVSIGDGPFNFSSSPASEAGLTATPQLPPVPEDVVVLTHSLDQSIVQFNSVSCNDGTGLHTDNSYLRKFTLADFGITSDLAITNVQIGIEDATGAGGDQPATMNLYLWDTATPFQWANFSLIGTANTVVPDQALTIIDVPVAGVAPAGSTLVVEFFTPNGQVEGNSLFVGSNPNGQTDSTYLAAADCGVPEPTPTEGIGFPDMHLVMNVYGETALAPDSVMVTFDVTVTAECGDVTNTAVLDYEGAMVSADTTLNAGPCCEPVMDVALSVLTAAPIYPGDDVEFSADIMPDGFTAPYNYTFDFGDMTPPATGSDSADPFTTVYSYTAPGTYTAEIGVWNCDMTEPLTDTVEVVVMETPQQFYYVYLPIIAKNQ
jgi:uncharacterized repeat protein (TIGR01451 family)